jgi:hypothetical protein
MNKKELIAEIKTQVRQYDESGLIDNISLNRWITTELKRFGVSVMELRPYFLHVENGKTFLPQEFYSLKAAYYCKPESFHADDECKQELQNSHMWKFRTEKLMEWDNESQSHIGTDYKCFEEKIVWNNCTGVVRYTKPQLVKLRNGKRNITCAEGCPNLKVASDYEITISKETLYTNFPEGTIYLECYVLPTDEDGEIMIYDNRNLQEYLIAYCTRKIIQEIWVNDDDVNLINKMNFFAAEESKLFGLAMTAVKMEALARSNWSQKLKAKNAKETNMYEKMFPNKNAGWRR